MVVVVSEDKVMERDGEKVDAPKRQRHDRETMEALSDQTEMDSKVWNNLREDLLQQIITRLPLKKIVQSQILSKAWRSRFQSPSFQKEVNILSSRWGPCNTYHPLCLTEQGLCGYDRSAQKWRDLCTLPEFPELPPFFENIMRNYVGSRWRLWGRNCFVVGALVFSGYLLNDGVLHIFVTNAVNKTIRRCPPVKLPLRLPSRAVKTLLEYLEFYVHPISRDQYKLVIVAYIFRRPSLTIMTLTVYDSKLDSWTESQSVVPSNWTSNGAAVCVKGVVYVPYKEALDGTMVFLTFDVEKELFRQITPPQAVRYQAHGTLVPFRSQLVLVSHPTDEISTEDLHVFTVDLETLQLTEISRGPARTFDYWLATGTGITDGECIHLVLQMYMQAFIDPVTDEEDEGFFEDRTGVRFDYRVALERTCLVSCELSKQLWSYSPMDSSGSGYPRDGRIELCYKYAFQPNLSPFMLAETCLLDRT